MNRQDILNLAAMSAYPAVTITLPTHRTSPDNRQDPIRLKNLLSQAIERLTAELGRREAEPVLRRLDELTSDVDHERNLDGLALFASADYAAKQRLPFTLPERVVVDQSFFTRDLVYALNRSPRYWVLALSEQATRLFEATRDDLEELTAGSPFPLAQKVRDLPGDPAVNVSQLRDEYSRGFAREIDTALATYMAADPLPLAVVGVDRWIAFFQEVTSHGQQIVATLTGNHDQTTGHDLGRLVWPLVRDGLAARREGIHAELNTAVGGQRTASTLGEVWRFAQEGRGQTLVVEEGYHEAATVDETGFFLRPAGEGAGPTLLDDAVDEIVETVLAKGGRVVFADDGTLEKHGRIALILRY